MVAVTGAFGQVAAAIVPVTTTGNQSTVRNWNLSLETTPPTYRASNTKLGTGRVPGRFDWSGTFEQFSLVPDVILWPGKEIDIQLYTAPDSGIDLTAGTVYTGRAIISEVALTWNWRDEEIPLTTISFQAAGSLTETPTIVPAVDVVVPDPVSICGLRIEFENINAIPVFETWANVARAELRFTADNPEVNNSSNIIAGKCFVDRTRGPLDFSLALLEDNHTISNLGTAAAPADAITIQANARIRLYTDATKFWLLEWAHVMSVTGLTVDIESGRVIEQTVNLGMQGFREDVLGTPPQIDGQIVNPDGTVLWPDPVLFP